MDSYIDAKSSFYFFRKKKKPDAHDLFLLSRELLVPRHFFFDIFGVLSRFSWTYNTERVKHVIGPMGAPIFFHLSYGNYGTLSYSKKNKLGGIKLRRDNAIFRNSQ